MTKKTFALLLVLVALFCLSLILLGIEIEEDRCVTAFERLLVTGSYDLDKITALQKYSITFYVCQ